MDKPSQSANQSPEKNPAVDQFFNRIESIEQADMQEDVVGRTPRYLRTLQEPPPRFHEALDRSVRALGNEEYNAFAESVSKDDRLSAYLPSLAISALTVHNFAPPEERKRIDVDGSGTISRTELKAAANDPQKFDPIYRKALEWADKNFGKIRSMSPDDGKYFGDSSDITPADLNKTDGELKWIGRLTGSIPGHKQLIDNFDAIDANKSGKITESEVNSWSNWSKSPLHYSVYPAKTDRMSPGSEELTKDQVQQRMLGAEAELKRIKQFWGLK